MTTSPSPVRPITRICPIRQTICMIALQLLLTIAALAQEPKVRTSLTSKGEVWVGQRVTLAVELLAPGFFSGTPTFDLPDPKGVLLIPPSESPVVSSEVIAGVSYTIQRHEISVFGQRAGELVIPPLTIRFHFKRSPLDKDFVPATVKTEPVRFTAKLPPGAEKLGSVISARNLKAVETWKPEPGKAKAGDAFTRTITFSAPDVPAMAFPPFPTGQIDGLGIYTKPPEVLDHSERGQLSGERRDTITYVCQRPGRFVIPAARFTWWDLDTHQLRTIDFPARVLDVAPNPALAGATPTPAVSEKPSTEKDSAWIVVALAAISLLFIPKRLWRRLRAPLRPVHLAPLNPPPSSKSIHTSLPGEL